MNNIMLKHLVVGEDDGGGLVGGFFVQRLLAGIGPCFCRPVPIQ